MKYGMCEYETDPGSRYIDPEPPTLCWADTAPWHDLCPEHGGPDINEPSPYSDDEDGHECAA